MCVHFNTHDILKVNIFSCKNNNSKSIDSFVFSLLVFGIRNNFYTEEIFTLSEVMGIEMYTHNQTLLHHESSISKSIYSLNSRASILNEDSVIYVYFDILDLL